MSDNGRSIKSINKIKIGNKIGDTSTRNDRSRNRNRKNRINNSNRNWRSENIKLGARSGSGKKIKNIGRSNSNDNGKRSDSFNITDTTDIRKWKTVLLDFWWDYILSKT